MTQRDRAGRPAALTRWEAAYEAFESPEQETRKFLRRLRRIGAERWDRSSRVLEVCCGRGSALRAWSTLGFSRIFGVDVSRTLVSRYRGPGLCILGDARGIPLASASCEVVVVQGGLHHLLNERDVTRALAEMRRVAVPRGRIVIIEPWRTPFLRLAHWLCGQRVARRLVSRFDALGTMIDEERETYERWLSAPRECMRLINRYVVPELVQCRWGKLIVVGSPVARGA